MGPTISNSSLKWSWKHVSDKFRHVTGKRQENLLWAESAVQGARPHKLLRWVTLLAASGSHPISVILRRNCSDPNPIQTGTWNDKHPMLAIKTQSSFGKLIPSKQGFDKQNYLTPLFKTNYIWTGFKSHLLKLFYSTEQKQFSIKSQTVIWWYFALWNPTLLLDKTSCTLP